RSTLKGASVKAKVLAYFRSIRVYLIATAVFLPLLYTVQPIVPLLIILSLIIISGYYVIISWKTISGAQWAIVIGLLLTFALLVLGLTFNAFYRTTIYPGVRYVSAAITLAFPLSLLVYVSLQFKETLAEVVALPEKKTKSCRCRTS